MSGGHPLALILGGSRGIGRASASALARDGFDIVLTYASQPDAASAAQNAIAAQYPDIRVSLCRMDVRDAASVAAAFDHCDVQMGCAPSCVLVNAGINRPPSPIHESDPDVFRELVEVNLIGAYLCLREAGRRVTDGGSIIAVSTSLVRRTLPGVGGYSAVKAGVESLVRAMAQELSSRQVRVNAVAPGPVDTDLFNSGKTDDAKQRSAAMSPLNRIGRPEEVAEVVAFLASSRASWVQGQVIQPNGGMA